MYRNRFLVMSRDGWRIGQCQGYRSSRVFRTVQQFSPWSGATIFGAYLQIRRPKMSPKIGNFEFYWISRRVRVGFSNCFDLHMHYYATVSASNFQVLVCCGWRKSINEAYLLFGWPSLYMPCSSCSCQQRYQVICYLVIIFYYFFQFLAVYSSHYFNTRYK